MDIYKEKIKMTSGSNFSAKYLSHFSALTSGGTVNYTQLNHGGQVPTTNSRPKPSTPVTQKPFVPLSAQTLVDRSVLISRSTGNTVSSSGGTKQVSLKSISGTLGISTPFTAGTLDTSFIDGLENTGFDSGGGNGVKVITIQPDGKILMGGDFYVYRHNNISYYSNEMIRINPDGSVDETFDIMYNPDCYGGGFDGDVSTIALQPDGKILAGGRFTAFDRDGNCDSANYIIRLNSDGSRDNTFNIGDAFNDYVYAIKVLSDGSILVGGLFTTYNGTNASRIIKLNSTGGIDPSFSIGDDTVSFSDGVTSIEVDNNGKILVGGNFSTYSGVSALSIIRLNPNGTIDNTFNSGTGFDGEVYSIVIEPSGTILIAGGFSTYNNVTGVSGLVRLNSDGTINTRFGYGFNNQPVYSIALQSDGKILVGGYFDYYYYDINNPSLYVDVYDLIRLNIDGSVDNTFYYGQLLDSTVYTITIQSNGYILAGGDFTQYGDYSPKFALRLYNQIISGSYVYVVYDCLQPLMDSPVTYTVSSNVPLNVGDTYSLQSISNPSVIVFGEISSDIPSTTVTHTLLKQYDSCEAALSGSTKLVVAKDCFGVIPDFNYLVDSRFKVGDIMFVDIVFDYEGPAFIKTPVTIIEEIPFVLDEYWPKLIPYQTYGSCIQALEANGIYYVTADCISGMTDYFLSKTYFADVTYINTPNGETDCKTVVDILTFGPYDLISAGTVVIQSTFTYKSCSDCLSKFQSATIDTDFAQNTYDADSIYDIKELSDGSLIVGASELTHIDDGDLYNFGNIVKLNQDGSLNLSFNPNTEGSLSLDGTTFIYTNYDEKFNLDGNFSIEFWIKFSSHDFNAGILSFKDSNDDNGWQVRFDGNDNYLAFEYNSDTLYTNIELPPNEWFHIAIVNNIDLDYLTLYINGDNGDGFTSGSTSGLTASSGTTFKVGIERTYDSYVTGLITNVRIVNGGNNFAYDDNFTPQTSPLRNRQDAYGSLRYVEPYEVVLLLNFADKFSTLADSSIYKIPFYINKPDVAKTNSASKCVCVSYLNTGPATVFNYYKCFEPGTISTGNLLQSVSLGAGQTSTSVCMQASSVNMNQNPNLILIYNQYGSSQCVLLGLNQYLCPGPCNCNSVKNNTANTIELKYYDCNRDYITGNFISPGAPEIQVCALYFDPSDLTIVNQGYQCSATTANYPYGWECLPPIDPRCKPLVLFSGSPSNIPGSTMTPIVGRFNFTTLSPANYTQINLTAGGAYPPVNTTGSNAFYNMSMTHIYNFDTDDGKLWIKFNTGTTNTTTLIYEFDILNSNFDCDYLRTITIQLGGSNNNNIIGPGMTAIDETTLILSRGFSINTANINYQLVRVNITSNTPNPSSDITTFVSLPLINNVAVGNNLGNLNPFSSIRMVEGNRVIVACKQGPLLQAVWAKYLLQYTYPGGVLEAVVPNITPDSDGAARGAYSYNDSIIEWRRPGNSISNSTLSGRGINLNSPYSLYGYPPYSWPTGNIQNMPNTAMALDVSSPYPNILAVSTCGLTRLND